MRRDLIQVSTLHMDDDKWYEFRQDGIGASEVAAVMGLNPYKSSIELFYEKIGQKPISRDENAAMFWGTELEKQIAEKWQYWNPDEPNQDEMIRNFRAGKIIRKNEKVNRFISNPSMPWLFVSLDRRIHKGIRGEEGALETKTISGWAAEQWEAGIPPMYVVQLQTGIMICDFNFGELAILKDGRWMEVYPFEKHETIQNSIKEMTYNFWELVVAAKPLVLLKQEAEKAGDLDRAELLQSQIDVLAPTPDGSLAYENYLKEKYRTGGNGMVKGNDEQYEIAKLYQLRNEEIKVLEAAKMECSNKLKAVIGNYDELSFDNRGKVTWKTNAKGSRVFKVAI